jgi:hypothetical protein
MQDTQRVASFMKRAPACSQRGSRTIHSSPQCPRSWAAQQLKGGSSVSAVHFEQSTHQGSAGRVSACQRVVVVRGWLNRRPSAFQAHSSGVWMSPVMARCAVYLGKSSSCIGLRRSVAGCVGSPNGPSTEQPLAAPGYESVARRLPSPRPRQARQTRPQTTRLKVAERMGVRGLRFCVPGSAGCLRWMTRPCTR